MVAAFVIGHLHVPRLGQHVDLLCVYSLNELEVCVAELEVVECEVDSNEVQGQVK